MTSNTAVKLAACLFLGLAGIAWAADSPDESSRQPSSDGAEVGFANLEDGQEVPPVFKVVFLVKGMGIAPAGVNIDNTGHHHLLIDVAQAPDFDQPLPQSDNIMHFDAGESEVELRLPEGSHTLQLVLADYAHLTHEPPVDSEVITVIVSADVSPPSAGSN